MRTLVILAILSASASAQDPAEKAPDVNATIRRGLDFLAKDAVTWKEAHNCVSCHHASMVVWSLREAKLRGHAVDEAVLSDMTRWVVESGDGKTSQERPAGKPKALNPKAVWFALALEADPAPDAASKASLKLLVDTVKGDQAEDGSWVAWPETRAPLLGGSDESMTALATLAVLPAAASGDAPARSALDQGLRWLADMKPDDEMQSLSLRLAIWPRSGRPAAEIDSLVARVKGRQNPDGGWSQTKDLPSDAWATGQALYALALAGTKPDDPSLTRAHAFLARTQRADGSWPMTSRPSKPGAEGAKSLIPITGAGSAWAVLGLVRSR